MSIHRIKWYNDVIFVVSDGWIVGWKNQSVLIELAKPFLINMIYKEMMKRKDWVIWRRRYIPHGSTHDYVNQVIKGVDIWQTITGLCTDVAFQDIFRIAAWLFAIGWHIKSFKPESKFKLTSSLVGNVIVYLCFLTFSSFSFSVRDLFQNRFLVRCVVTYICREMGLFTGANDVPVVKVFALHSSTSLVRYTKKLFRTNSWLTLCFILSQ